MTHAALKDLADELEALNVKQVDVGGIAVAVERATISRFASRIRAAISAMEGEADGLAGQIADVAWDFLVAKGYTNEDFDAVPLTIIRDNLSQRKGDTAPPPQQAADRSWLLELVPEAQAFNDGMEDREWCAGFNSCRRMTLGNIERSALATQPQQED